MNIALTGATGFIGIRLTKRLREEGHTVRAIGRRAPGDAGVLFYPWNADAGEPPAEALDGADAVIHLAGEPVAQRWNTDVKRRIRESRSTGTRYLVQALSTVRLRPRVLISASAIGYYGDRADELLVESSPPGQGFLPEVCVAWEAEARLAAALGMRIVMIRIGIVLGQNGGALKQMLTPFRLGLGGPLAGGRQWMSWIHIDDLVEMFRFVLLHEKAEGAWNGTAPEPVRNVDFTRALGAAIHRPAVIPVPAFALKLLYGEMAGVMLASQRVLPESPLRAGFTFRYPTLGDAFETIFGAAHTTREAG